MDPIVPDVPAVVPCILQFLVTLGTRVVPCVTMGEAKKTSVLRHDPLEKTPKARYRGPVRSRTQGSAWKCTRYPRGRKQATSLQPVGSFVLRGNEPVHALLHPNMHRCTRRNPPPCMQYARPLLPVQNKPYLPIPRMNQNVGTLSRLPCLVVSNSRMSNVETPFRRPRLLAHDTAVAHEA